MSYLVLARKYRPQSFDEVQGQAHITKILKNAIEGKRIGHAFLFCGPRGIGKTSCARILAKSLNCQEGPTLTPCGQCFTCQEIVKGNSFDVIEIDGASNRGIDEIRALRENVKFAPSYGRYKIYIVDEVHMLTTEAFNALLKTLEEPPDHVVFIFATTESNKVPATILSRCQRFDFKRISLETISANLKSIGQKEGVKIEDEALFAIAKAAGGSMRDALSILDQLAALGEKGVKTEDVYSMLGIVEMEYLFALTDALLAGNCPLVMQVLSQIIDAGKDLKQLVKDLTEHFRHLMIARIGGPQLNDLIDYPKNVKERLAGQSQKISITGLLHCIDLFIEAQETSRVMETTRMPLEIALAKITLGQAAASGVGVPVQVTQATVSAPAAQPKPAIKALPEAPKVVQAAPGANSSAPSPSVAVNVKPGDLSLQDIQKSWSMLTHEVSRQKMSLATYLQEANACHFNAGALTIGFSKDHLFAKESLESKDNRALVEKIFTSKLGCTIHINFKIIEGSLPKDAQPIVKETLEMFGGKVVKEWHNEEA